MKTCSSILFLFILMLSLSCQSSREKSGDFKLLPQPKEFVISGTSSLDVSDIKGYILIENTSLPVLPIRLKNIKPAEKESGAQLICDVDESLAMNAEGYTLEISAKKIWIAAKDQSGLFYGLQTLAQLMTDAEDQEVKLPLCKIADHPSLAYRAIQLDIKHHREKLEYYYELIDWLASYKVNAIIAEVEDKIKYERQALIGSVDAFTI